MTVYNTKKRMTSVESFSVKCAPTTANCGNVSGHESDQHLNTGISVLVAALFVLGALAGAGIMAMPNAFMKAGEIGSHMTF